MLAGAALATALALPVASADHTPSGNLTFEVSSSADEVDSNPGDGDCVATSGECTLRAAIQEANALSGHQTIVLPPGEFVLTRDGYEENASAVGGLDVLDDVTIVGAGSSVTGVTEDAFAVDRIFDVREGVVSITDVAIHDVFMSSILSNDGACGGGIRNFSDLTVSRVVVRKNTFRGGGGGICSNSGTLRLSDSLIEGNIAALTGPGGGVMNASGLAILERLVISSNRSDTTGGGGIANYGSMVVRDSLITDNSTEGQADGAGGIDNRQAPGGQGYLLVINSTISANRGDPQGGSGGGGISSKDGGVATLVNSTVVGNEASASQASGIYTRNDGSKTTLVNTLVADNDSANCPPNGFWALPGSLGHNLDSDGSCQLAGPGDLSEVDPLLGGLADNGGPTMTHALLAGSPARNAGDNAECPEGDQRGAPRNVGACDIGAFEAGSVVPPPAPLPGDVDCDGALTPFDMLALLRHTGSLGAPPPCIALADLDCDGDIDLADALILLRRLTGFIDPPCDPG